MISNNKRLSLTILFMSLKVENMFFENVPWLFWQVMLFMCHYGKNFGNHCVILSGKEYHLVHHNNVYKTHVRSYGFLLSTIVWRIIHCTSIHHIYYSWALRSNTLLCFVIRLDEMQTECSNQRLIIL